MKSLSPGIEDYPTAFWSWNDRLDAKKLTAQLDGYCKWGLRSVLIHPMPDHFRKKDFFGGMTTPYLSPEYFECVQKVVERAAENGMQVWLYDEGGWPSGLAAGLILKQRPDLQARVMTRNGARYTDPPRTDLLHPDTTKLFIQCTHEGYRKVVGDYFGTTIPGVFTDEPSVPGQVGTAELPWTDDLPEEFERRKGRPLEPLLPLLLGPPKNREARQIRIEFVEVWTDLYAERFFDPCRSFCHRYKLKLVGHLLGDQSLRAHARCSGDFFKLLGRLDEPGIDAVWGQIDGRRPRSFFPAFAASAAKNPGGRCWSESGAAYGHGLTIQELKAVVDHQLVQGINKFCPMYLLQSTRQGRWVGTGTRPLDQAPDAAHYPDLEAYLAQAGKLLREGRLYRPVELHYPIEALWTHYDRGASAPFNRQVGELSDRNIAFVFSPDAPRRDTQELEKVFRDGWPFPQRVEADPGIRWVAFSLRREEFAFCVNHTARSRRLTLQPSGVKYTLAPGESRFMSLTHPQAETLLSQSSVLRHWEWKPLTQWEIGPQGPTPRKLRKQPWQEVRLGSWEGPAGEGFAGSCLYRTTFDWQPVDGDAVELNLGKVCFAVQVTLNGKPLGRRAWSPFRFDIAPALRPGLNRLELEVDGSLANLFLDAEVKQRLKDRGWWNVYLEKAQALERQRTGSGLYGPVRIQWEASRASLRAVPVR